MLQEVSGRSIKVTGREGGHKDLRLGVDIWGWKGAPEEGSAG